MSQEAVRATLEAPRSGRRGVRMWVRRFRRDKRATFGSFILVIFVICAIFGGLIAPYEPLIQSDDLLKSPSLQHPLGTDNLGRDVFSRLIVGARTSMIVGLFGLVLAALVGIPLGVLSGYYGGWIDMVVGRYIDIQWAFPNFIIAVMMVGIFGLGLQNVIIAIFLAYIDDFARVVRGMVLALKEEDYVTAGRASGASDFRLMMVHIFPNAMPPVIVLASVFFSSAILIEAGLTFLGLGVRPDTPTWGLILNDARPFFQTAWWLAIFPGLVIMLVVLSVNFVGDAIRDLNDVHEYGPGSTGA
ncbi:MAG: ABC transporter permease [Chloroflexi bacterium]|nr:ABC transporter permease [Chloroflexota bacterium]